MSAPLLESHNTAKQKQSFVPILTKAFLNQKKSAVVVAIALLRKAKMLTKMLTKMRHGLHPARCLLTALGL